MQQHHTGFHAPRARRGRAGLLGRRAARRRVAALHHGPAVRPGQRAAANGQVPGDTTNVYGSFAGRVLSYAVIVCYPTSATTRVPITRCRTARAFRACSGRRKRRCGPTRRRAFRCCCSRTATSEAPPRTITSTPWRCSRASATWWLRRITGRPLGRCSSRASPMFLPARAPAHFLAMQAVRACAVDDARSPPRDATMEGPHRSRPDRRIRREPRRRIRAADGRRGHDDSVGLLDGNQDEPGSRLPSATFPISEILFPAFGRDQHGLDGVAIPYLAIGGTADTTAPIEEIAAGVLRLQAPASSSPRQRQARLRPRLPADIFTWALTFLDAEVRGDAAARAVSDNGERGRRRRRPVIVPLMAPPGHAGPAQLPGPLVECARRAPSRAGASISRTRATSSSRPGSPTMPMASAWWLAMTATRDRAEHVTPARSTRPAGRRSTRYRSIRRRSRRRSGRGR